MTEAIRILVTNDDGIRAPGIAALAQALSEVGETWVYAPDREQSGVGHGVSLHRPLRVTEVAPRWYEIDGTPTDCVMLAVRGLMPSRPHLVVSGINSGANLGDDVTYSGTVAGAYEGTLLGVPSIAISDVAYQPKALETAGRVAIGVARSVLEHGLPDDTMLNVNVPDLPYGELRGLSLTHMGRRDYGDEIIRRKDPRGTDYYWIGGSAPGYAQEEGTDFEAIEGGRVSVTPLHRDVTNYAAAEALRKHELTL